jgi:xylitol oxidase
MTQQRTNWARNLVYSTESLHIPTSVEEVQEIVKNCQYLRVLGSKCSFNKISDSAHHQLSLEKLNKIISLDKENKTVTVEGGLKYGELCQFLHENGFALHNTASLPHITIAGACATGTHGSGVNNKNLPTAVCAIEFVNAKGEIVSLSRAKDGEHFKGAVISLGSLGVITKLTLDLVPTFDMQQVVYTDLPMQTLEKNFMNIMSSAYSVSLITDFSNKNIRTVWLKSKVENGVIKSFPNEFYGAKLLLSKSILLMISMLLIALSN